MLRKSYSRLNQEMIRTIDVSGVLGGFTQMVQEQTYHLHAELARTGATLSGKYQIPDSLANRLSAECAKHVENAPAKQRDELRAAVDAYRNSEVQILLLSGLPVENISLPPRFNERVPDTVEFRANYNIMAGIMLGVYGHRFRDTHEYRRMMLVTPKREESELSFDTNAELRWHSDGYAADDEEFIAGHTVLLCINGDEKVKTKFLSGARIFYMLSEEDRKILMDKNFYVENDSEFGPLQSPFFSIFKKDGNGIINIRYGHLGKIMAETPEAKEALQHLDAVIANLKEEAVTLALSTGQICSFNNRTQLHSRTETPIKSTEGEFRRLLVRAEMAQYQRGR